MSSMFAAREPTEAVLHQPMASDAKRYHSCDERALGMLPAPWIRSIVVFLVILAIFESLIALIRRMFIFWDVQIGFAVPKGSQFIAG